MNVFGDHVVLGRRVILAAVVAFSLVVTAGAVKGHWLPLPGVVIATAGGVGSLAQLLRYRRPLVAAVAGSASYVLSANPVPLLLGLTAALLHGKRRWDSYLATAAAVLGWIGWGWVDEGRVTVGSLQSSVWVVVVVVACRYLVARRALFDALQAEVDHAEQERVWHEERARTSERERIAREMHDVVAHKVSLIALHAGAVELRAEESDRVREGAALIQGASHEALQELREVLGLLRENTDSAPYVHAGGVSELVADFVQAGLAIDLHDGVGEELPSGTDRVVLRVVQEALTNAVKHAPEAPVRVTLERDPGGAVQVAVENAVVESDGPRLPGAGAGLIGLAERVRLVGGAVAAGPSDDGRSWQLHATVPWLAGVESGREGGGPSADLGADRR